MMPSSQPEKGFNLSEWALNHRAFTRYLMVVLLLLGVAAYFQLGQDEDPPFTFRAMVVRTYWPGATAQQVAEQVTDKIERVLQEAQQSDDAIDRVAVVSVMAVNNEVGSISPLRQVAKVVRAHAHRTAPALKVQARQLGRAPDAFAPAPGTPAHTPLAPCMQQRQARIRRATLAAWNRFQTQAGLPLTDRMDAATLDRLPR